MMKSSEMPVEVPNAMPKASAIFEAVRFISSLSTPRLALRSTSVSRLTSPAANWTTATFAWSPSMMMKLGPAISMFSKTRAPDCAISVLIAESTAGLTPLWMSLATVNPFPSAITDPRMPFVFRRNSLRIFPSCPSMPSSEKLERAAFRRDSLRCIPVPPGPVEDRGLLEEHRATGIRLLHETEERAFRRPDDEQEFVGPVPHAAQPDDQQPGSDRRGEAEGNCGSANQDGERDDREGKRTQEPLNPLFHDEHPGPSDVFVHAREGEERHGEETRDGPEE